MSRLRPRGRTVAAWVVGLALLALASLLLRVVPSAADSEQPFVVSAEPGETAVGRTIEVTVSDVMFADTLRSGGWEQQANWLVVDISAEAAGADASTYLGRVALVLHGGPDGDREYRASERFPSLTTDPLIVGVPLAGSLAFELPAGAAGHASLELAEHADTRLDSLLRFDVDLDAVERLQEYDIADRDWGHR
ncbi:hypothetical protein [Leucobacter sp. G161]|uniref:hypothetical protein n=1 Tax=Leucobacter sp. G161 TaxID=663704 RepID=UPI000ACA509C|nr:hypothetical protein [Leucobacter sp. G161]